MELIQAVRGARDILPEEVGYWQWVEAIARETLTQAAYREIRTPILELTALYERGMGETTDVVGKEMYTFQDKGDRWVSLRPEGTAGVVRALVQHGLVGQGGIQRLWYSGPMFRYENPQAGRQRQFHQLGVELLGSPSPRADAETIALATQILQTLGLKTLRLNLNSIGSPDDRQQYRAALVEYLTPYKADLDPDSQDRLTRNPLRILDSKNERTQAILTEAPSLLDQLSPASQARFEQVKHLLSALGIEYDLNPRLVRGLDYYTHTVFELQSDELGAQATVCAGGRYDGLVAELGGAETPAIGWAIGLERLIILLQKLQAAPPTAIDFYIVSRGVAAEAQAIVLAQALRRQRFTVELDLSGSAFGKQAKRADRSGAVACLILGDAEAEAQTVQLKWMAAGTQETVSQAALCTNPAELRRQIDQQRQAEPH
jgi:histidyl-tRNA synthetase